MAKTILQIQNIDTLESEIFPDPIGSLTSRGRLALLVTGLGAERLDMLGKGVAAPMFLDPPLAVH